MRDPGRPDKIALIKVPVNLGGSSWGKDLSSGPDHIHYNGALDLSLGKSRKAIYKQFTIAPDSQHQHELDKNGELEEIIQLARKVQLLSRQLFNDEYFVVLLGGPQTVDLGFVAGAATSTVHGKPQTISLSSWDGHLDLNTEETTNTGSRHGQTLASHAGYGNQDLVGFHGNVLPRVEGKNILIVGPNTENRTFFTGELTSTDMARMLRREQSHAQEMAHAKQWNIRTISVDNCDDNAILGDANMPLWQAQAVAALNARVKRTTGHVVLLDMDVLRQDEAPGVGMRNPEGMTLDQILQLADNTRDLAAEKLMGIAVVEVDPQKDAPDHRTAKAARQIIDRLTFCW